MKAQVARGKFRTVVVGNGGHEIYRLNLIRSLGVITTILEMYYRYLYLLFLVKIIIY
jgi:hypothetical protein